jgi:hypothetical protein
MCLGKVVMWDFVWLCDNEMLMVWYGNLRNFKWSRMFDGMGV